MSHLSENRGFSVESVGKDSQIFLEKNRHRRVDKGVGG